MLVFLFHSIDNVSRTTIKFHLGHELIQFLPSIFWFMFMNRGKIYEKLRKNKTGLLIMSPIMVPYVIYGLIKLAKDEELNMLMLNAKKQKKISDFF